MSTAPAQNEDDFEDDDEYDPDDGLLRVINISNGRAKFEIDGTNHVLRPSEIRTIPRAYCVPRKFQKNSPALPSVVEMLTGAPKPNVVPITHKSAKGKIDELRKANKLDAGTVAELRRHERQLESLKES